MNPNLPGYGDAASWPPCANHPLDPRNDTERAESIDIAECWARAQAIAHDPDALDHLQADCLLDYSKIQIKVDRQYRDLFAAAEYLRLRVMDGRHAEADVIARDMTYAIAEEVDVLIRAGKL